MNTKSQYGFEQINISDKLDEVIKKAIERAKKEKKRKSKLLTLILCILNFTQGFL